jgi:hypothetical protein
VPALAAQRGGSHGSDRLAGAVRTSRSFSASITASPSQATDGNNVTVSFTMTNPNAGDYIGLFNTTGEYGGVWFFDNSCGQTPGASGVASGSCTVSTSPVTPGFYVWALYRSNGTVAASSATQTIVANTTIGSCSTAEPSGSVTSGGHPWTLVGRDDFNKAAPLGSLASSNGNTVVYTGDQGLKWTEYGDGWPSTYSGGKEGYQPSTVQSVHDGVLDWYLHNDSKGNPVSATPMPVLAGGSDYQTYGRYSFCEKIVPSDTHFLDDFKQAIMLWPQNQSDGLYAESDFPEGNLNQTVFNAFAHYGGNSLKDVFWTEAINTDQWHVYTQEWAPGYRNYYIDGQLVGTSTSKVWSEPERWNLQIEMNGLNDGATGHVYVDWAAIWSY